MRFIKFNDLHFVKINFSNFMSYYIILSSSPIRQNFFSIMLLLSQNTNQYNFQYNLSNISISSSKSINVSVIKKLLLVAIVFFFFSRDEMMARMISAHNFSIVIKAFWTSCNIVFNQTFCIRCLMLTRRRMLTLERRVIWTARMTG